MGIFSKPKRPQCGQPVTETGYSFPFPQYRCEFCIKRATEKAELEERISRLENIIQNQNPKDNG